MKYQRALKLLNCLYVVVMTTFLRSISHKICSIKINVLLVWIPISWWFWRTLETIHNFLLFQDKYVGIKWAYKEATLTPHTYLILDLKGDTKQSFWVRINILEDPQHVYIAHWKRKRIFCKVTMVLLMFKNIQKNLPMLIALHCSSKAQNSWNPKSKNIAKEKERNFSRRRRYFLSPLSRIHPWNFGGFPLERYHRRINGWREEIRRGYTGGVWNTTHKSRNTSEPYCIKPFASCYIE